MSNAANAGTVLTISIIRALRGEAGEAGDDAMVSLCDDAERDYRAAKPWDVEDLPATSAAWMAIAATL